VDAAVKAGNREQETGNAEASQLPADSRKSRLRERAIAIIARMKSQQLLLVSLVLCAGFSEAATAFAQTNSTVPPAKSTAFVTVPFVGCASDGQAGPQKAPVGKNKAIAIPAGLTELAERLAYYKAEYSPGVLAPRGWNCFLIYGSGGSDLFVTPDSIDSKELFSDDWKGFPGQGVQLSFDNGGTSGRFEVAKVIARVFPEYKTFAQGVIAEGIEPASDFPFGPYPSDKLTYRAKNIVEFETPANAQGLGTDSRLQMNESPIYGVAIISGADTDLVQLSARVPANDSDLVPAMIARVEVEAAAAPAH
jgi:hypothetical protein